ncbi:MAG: hypothetical protein HW390_52 [Candidatus Brocadiaceae bacterium]|nr:hypothetical protein [Candidatus Brocadiaceae bacterium]
MYHPAIYIICLDNHVNYAMIGELTVRFRKKIGIQRKGVVEDMNKFHIPPLPPASGGHVGCDTLKGLMVIIVFFT